ncbi:DUF6881 domain-containing protein [Streptomyces sp. 4N509B]|uniref:DUF6881 domain-containing protein n=1 Tax=Streptomyces sp. 4N509B TaxID=3457413 RepID=UPI003FD46006
MRYWKVYWHHDFPDEPVAIYSEVGPDGHECRRVEEFPGARVGWADPEREVGGCALAEVPPGDLATVATQPEFTAFSILREEFEGVWLRARRSTGERDAGSPD